jgi:membrane protein DedA with SNARE-associated domain
MELVGVTGRVSAAGIAIGAHAHHYHHYASIDLLGLAAAAAASWIGVPGPGEPVLVAAAILAAKHHLAIGSVLAFAFAGAMIGGVAGWAIGIKAGRRLLSRPGPLLRLRLHALERGEQVFARAPVIAVLMTPSWVAGIHRASATVFLPVNALGAAVWAVGIGVGAYYAGPPILDAAGDVSIVGSILLVIVILGLVAGEVHRRRRGGEPGAGDPRARSKPS